MPPSVQKISSPQWNTDTRRRSPSISSAKARICTTVLRPGPIWSARKWACRTGSTTAMSVDDERYAVPTVDRVKSLKDRLVEVELGFSKKTGHAGALRCLNCDVQTVFDYSTCIECDACVDICPESCINFIENGDEEDLRARLLAPADNSEQDLYVSEVLPTGRVMVKDENVCLHCGLCAERCPTSSWEMMQFTYNSAAGRSINEQDKECQRLCCPLRQRQRFRFGQRQ